MTVSLRSIHESDDSREAVWLYLPTSERQIERMLWRYSCQPGSVQSAGFFG